MADEWQVLDEKEGPGVLYQDLGQGDRYTWRIGVLSGGDTFTVIRYSGSGYSNVDEIPTSLLPLILQLVHRMKALPVPSKHTSEHSPFKPGSVLKLQGGPSMEDLRALIAREMGDNPYLGGYTDFDEGLVLRSASSRWNADDYVRALQAGRNCVDDRAVRTSLADDYTENQITLAIVDLINWTHADLGDTRNWPGPGG